MSGGPAGRLAAGLAIVLVAFNLRPLFASVAPVLPELVAGLAISPAAASLLTTAPVLCLGLFAPAAPGLALRFGFERLLLGCLAALALGTALRGVASFPVLLAGVVIGGIAVATMNVAITGLVKRDFADRVALVTGSYSLALCVGAALAAGLTAPLAAATGSFSLALAAWALPVLVAACMWAWAVPLRRPAAPAPGPRPPAAGGPWRDPLAWQVTLFTGTQSALAYIVFGWLAPILRERGLDPAAAGLVTSLSILAQAPASFCAPWLATIGRDQRAVSMALVALATVGLVGLIAAPLAAAPVWAVVQGLGQGGLFSLTMVLYIRRTRDPASAAGLAGMAQGVGYLMAGAAPFALGLLRSSTGGFGAALPLVAGIGAACLAAAWGAGRDRQLGTGA